MDIRYDLTEDDLREVQTQVYAEKQEALRRSPVRVVLAVILAGLLVWPLWARMVSRSVLLSEPAPRLALFMLMLGVAGLLAFTLRGRVPQLRIRRLETWSIERMVRESIRRSVLGPVTVSLGDDGLVRTNAAGERRVAWEEVKDLLHSPRMLTVRLRREHRVIPIPTRVFADAPTAEAYVSRLETLTGKRRFDVEAGAPAHGWFTVPKRQPVRPLLLVALGLAVIVLGFDRGLSWYYDPRPGNPPERVIVYGTSWCPVCARLRECLGRHHVPFEERDVDTSPRAEAEWWVLGGSGVPVTLVGPRVAHGLDPEELRGVLGEAGYHVDCSGSGQSSRRSR
ncbi:MAG: glutaredoxin family protein [Myxococcaceae bacterium]|nr:glutaredoxin family protein [Myxococcaceae bacterium]MCI0673511.1 glutaredoxin family protein [Myxococcaceae bacterium]